MPWGRCDDSFYDHRKVRSMPKRIRNEAAGLYWRAISLSNRHLSDGLIHDYDLALIDARQPVLDALVDAGLFERIGSDYLVHDFGDFNKTAAEVLDDRAKKQAAGRRGGVASGKARGKQSRSKSEAEPEAPASRVVRESLNSRPVPSQTHTQNQVPTTSRVLLTADQLAAWEDFSHPRWQPFREAWLSRGFYLPPHGAWDDPTSQRAILWEVADAYPVELGEWVRSAPGRSARDVVGFVLDRYHDARQAAAERADAQEAESERHKGSRRSDASALTRLGDMFGSQA